MVITLNSLKSTIHIHPQSSGRSRACLYYLHVLDLVVKRNFRVHKLVRRVDVFQSSLQVGCDASLELQDSLFDHAGIDGPAIAVDHVGKVDFRSHGAPIPGCEWKTKKEDRKLLSVIILFCGKASEIKSGWQVMNVHILPQCSLSLSQDIFFEEGYGSGLSLVVVFFFPLRACYEESLSPQRSYILHL